MSLEEFPVTDYEIIADRYDRNPIRRRIGSESIVSTILDRTTGPVRILDLACGTGNFLAAHRDYFPEERITWCGLDRSERMLGLAREKLPGVDLYRADAGEMPLDSASFDLVICSYAFHHFERKTAALAEVHRILRSEAVLLIRNICPEYMLAPWVYHYFPETREIDTKRFWDPRRIYRCLAEQGFRTEIDIQCEVKTFGLADLLAEAENRDASQLTLISEASYQNGLAKMRSALDAGEEFIGDFATIRVEAQKTG